MDLEDRLHEPVEVLVWDVAGSVKLPSARTFQRLEDAVRWVVEEASSEERACARISFERDHLTIPSDQIGDMYAQMTAAGAFWPQGLSASNDN